MGWESPGNPSYGFTSTITECPPRPAPEPQTSPVGPPAKPPRDPKAPPVVDGIAAGHQLSGGPIRIYVPAVADRKQSKSGLAKIIRSFYRIMREPL